MGLNASTLFLISTAATTIGTISSVRAQRAAIQRENYRLETERRLAEVQALEEGNARTEIGLQELANNLAYQSTAGYLDNSMIFININRQVKKNTEKDLWVNQHKINLDKEYLKMNINLNNYCLEDIQVLQHLLQVVLQEVNTTNKELLHNGINTW